jgi:hypothetical protein
LYLLVAFGSLPANTHQTRHGILEREKLKSAY